MNFDNLDTTTKAAEAAFFASGIAGRSTVEGAAVDHRLVEARKSATPPKKPAIAPQSIENLLYPYPLPYDLGPKWERPSINPLTEQDQWERRELNEHIWSRSTKGGEAVAGEIEFDEPPQNAIDHLITAQELTTEQRRAETEARAGRLDLGYNVDRETGNISQVDYQRRGVVATIEHREWSGEYRIRTQAEMMAAMPKPDVSGARITKTLTLRGARQISDACSFMSERHGGYTTFLTLTLDDDARARVASDKTTIQAEIKRFFDGANRVFQRGFSYTNKTGERVRVEPYHGAPKNWDGQSVPYCWVIEIPKNAQGEDNPHCHILMGWRVAHKHFDAWSKRLESLWGQGFAHLEKIKEPENAGAYIAKAAGYLTKGQGADDQGEVRGNRYWIAKPCRAPGWECVGRFQAGTMGGLIKDVHSYMQWRYGAVFDMRRESSQALADVRKKEKQGHRCQDKQKIAERLLRARRAIDRIPARASKYQLIIKGRDAFHDFMHWAQGRPKAKSNFAPWLPNCRRQPWYAIDPAGSKQAALFQKTINGRLPNDRNQNPERIEYDDFTDYEGVNAGKTAIGRASPITSHGCVV